MSLNQFIPAGRTSVVNRNGVALHVQTEYAFRPYPRVTTTIVDNGRVLHKVEKKLQKGIESIEEQAQMEEVIKQQHFEIMDVMKDEKEKGFETSETTRVEIYQEPTVVDKLLGIPGVEKVYYLDKQGSFMNEDEESVFKTAYPALFKSLDELTELFMTLPGADMNRERGVYEVERDRLYLASVGKEYYFVTVSRIDGETDFEQEIKKVITPEAFF